MDAEASSPTARSNNPRVPTPTAAQQRVLERIAAQRSRVKARRAAHVQSLALAQERRAAGGGDDSLVGRAAGFVREHPLAVAALAGAGLVVGPRRLVHWVGVLLPLLVRLKR